MDKSQIKNKIDVLKFEWSQLQNEIESFDMSKFALNKELMSLIDKQNKIKDEIYQLEDNIKNG